jgi:hypothetical protein
MPESDLKALSGDWWPVSGEDATQLEQELARETPEGHALRDVTVQALAVKRQLKDVVFWVPATEQWALVHLTRSVETDPSWPATFLTDDWDQVVAEFIAR